MFRDELVSCYKDTAKPVLFHDVKMKGHIRRWEFYSLPNKTMNRRSHCGIDRSWRAQAAPLFCGYLRYVYAEDRYVLYRIYLDRRLTSAEPGIDLVPSGRLPSRDADTALQHRLSGPARKHHPA
jgi:hypothetical protein